MCPGVVCGCGVRIWCVVLYSIILYIYVVCVMKLAACTGDAAQSLLSSQGLGEGLRRKLLFIEC